jgi:TolB-like protein/Tfp pilus assembly protein PilF
VEKPFSAYRGDAPYVFVCYAHEDAESVYGEIGWLHGYAVNIWYDEGISPGLEWTEELASAIQGCTKVLFFVTPNSVTSEHCRRELNFAHEEAREVVAVHLQPTQVPAGLRLSLNNRQAILKHELSEEEYRQRLMRVTHAGAGHASIPVPASRTRSSRRGLWLASAAIAACVVAAATWLWEAQDKSSADAESITAIEVEALTSPEVLHKSIAVLPFDNLSLDPENAYFAAGIHEEILNQLAKISDLSVIARTTMLRYADTDKTVPEIGGELNVRTVMEGSVRYADDRVRITAQLIDAGSGAHLWSEAYEDRLEDIFAIQLSIATKIARTLEAEFSADERTRIATRATDNPEAYAHYLRAVSGWGNYAPTGPMHEAVDAAITLDPEFAAAWAFKAFLHAMEAIAGGAFVGPDFGVEDQRRFAALAAEHALQALELDPDQARAHWALASVQRLNRDWQAGQRSIDRAYAINPNDYIVLNAAAWNSLGRGEVGRGVQLMQRSVALNPGDFANQGNFSGFLIMSEQWEDARRQASLMITLAPDAAFGYDMLAQVLSHLGDSEGVRTNAAKAEARYPVTPSPTIANAYTRIGDEANARRIFDRIRAGVGSKTLNFWTRFWLHMAVGDHEVALNYLERALDEGFPPAAANELHYLSNHPRFDPIRAHPKFAELVQRAGLPRDQGKSN